MPLASRLSGHRWWISLAYCLTAVLSQGLHVHVDRPGAVATMTDGLERGADPHAACQSSGTAGHLHRTGGPFAPPLDDHCPACQFQHNHHAPLNGALIGAVAASSAIRSGPDATFADRRLIRASCRAPPIRS